MELKPIHQEIEYTARGTWVATQILTALKEFLPLQKSGNKRNKSEGKSLFYLPS